MTEDYMVQFAKRAEGLSGQSLFNHVSTLIEATTSQNNKLAGIQDLELLSRHIKQKHFTHTQLPLDTQLKHHKPKRGTHSLYYDKLASILDKGSKTKLQNVLLCNPISGFHALKTAGISIGEFNNNLVDSVLKGMAQKNVLQMRFWGKILGLKDYFVIQAVTKTKVGDQIPADQEPEGQGVNYYSFWVTTDLLSDWVQLPLISPQHVRSAKQIKHVFTGDLEKPIGKYPIFKGKEKHLLKAQIARITHNCEIVPAGLYKPNDQKPETIEFEEEFKVPDVAELASPEKWVHLNQSIFNQGRCTYYYEPTLTQEEKATASQQAEKETVERLKSIADDAPLEALGTIPVWSIQQLGETQIVTPLNETTSQTSYGVVLLKNLNWPGFSTVGYSGGWVNIYIGYGCKVSQGSFTPVSPKEIGTQGEDRQEIRQPNPSQPSAVPVAQSQQRPADQEPQQALDDS